MAWYNDVWNWFVEGFKPHGDYALNPKNMLDDLNIPYDDSNSFSLTDPFNVGKGMSDVANSFSGILGELPNAIKDFLGVTQREHLNKADSLAQQAQNFNEQYSREAMAQQASQFQQDLATANRNIDFQKDIAEKNLAMQQDVFNAQMHENEITRQREDTAYQRQVADLKAAGFSPLMASNGAGAAVMSVGSAPQYDSSAVATAQGSAINMAREYAALKNMADGQYLTRKQAATNERIGAMLALSDLAQQRKMGFQNLALQSFNLANNIKDSKKRREQIDEQIESSKAQRSWMDSHGYRNQNAWSIILPVLEKVAERIGFDEDSLSKLVPKITINNLSQLYDGTDKGFNELKDKTQVLKNSSISKNSFDDLMSQLVEPSNVSSDTVHDWYTSMNKEFQDRFSYGYFYDAVTGKSKYKRSFLTKYLMFGNSGNL